MELGNKMNTLVVYGVMKSGNHLFIRWYIENLIRTYYTEFEIHKMGIKFFLDDYKPYFILEDKIIYLNDITNVHNLPIELKGGIPKNLILSIEDTFKHVKINENIIEPKRVFVFRSLHNLIASQLNAPERERLAHRFEPIEEVMEKYIKLYEKYTKYGGILVHYDRFIVDSEYEHDLAKKLGVELHIEVKQLERVTHHFVPGKSSFTDTKYNDRYKHLDEVVKNKIDEFISRIEIPDLQTISMNFQTEHDT